MKRLEELGISPAPWFITKHGEIYSQEGFIFGIKRVELGARVVFTTDADARLIAAAPKLYEKQYHDCVALRSIVAKLDEGAEVLNLRDILAEMADRMEAALAEAAGEEVAE